VGALVGEGVGATATKIEPGDVDVVATSLVPSLLDETALHPGASPLAVCTQLTPPLLEVYIPPPDRVATRNTPE